MTTENVITICNVALEIMLLPKVTTLFSTENKSALQIKGFINQIAMDLKKVAMPLGGFKELYHEFTLTTFENGAIYDLPSNFDRFVNDTFYSKTHSYALSSPSAVMWQDYKNSVSGQNTVCKRFRLKAGNKIELDPVPTQDGEVLNFAYIGNQLFSNFEGTEFYERPQKDTDLFLLDSEILIRGLLVNLKSGFDDTKEINDFTNAINNLKRDNSAATRFNLFSNSSCGFSMFNRIAEG